MDHTANKTSTTRTVDQVKRKSHETHSKRHFNRFFEGQYQKELDVENFWHVGDDSEDALVDMRDIEQHYARHAH